ncbi:MAG: hypothetical protein H7070_07595 [Saprospiraceae bacterium]|nr:hypothetical protein [Pyrinomonadaceae bacterium]
MTFAKKILITTESREIFIIRNGGTEIFTDHCSGCATDVELLTLEAAVLLSGIAVREIVRLAETGEIHFRETASGHLYVCRRSLCRDVHTGVAR